MEIGGTAERLGGRTVLVTGASGDIGVEIVRVLGNAGANVIAHWGRNADRAEAACADIPEERKLVVGADFTDPHSVEALWHQSVAWKGKVDVLVNNAAIMPEAALDATDEDWDSAWNTAVLVNLLQPARLMRSAVNHYRDTGGGVVIAISSWAAQRGSGNANLSAYAATKAGLAAATKTIARSFARNGVLAYCIAPGPVDTEMTRQSALSQGGIEAVKNALSMGELVTPSEVAGLVAVLAGGEFRHLSGATLDVNGATYIR